MAGIRGEFRRMVGISLIVHLILGVGFLWQMNLRAYQRVSFPVMEVRMVTLPGSTAVHSAPEPPLTPVRPVVKPVKSRAKEAPSVPPGPAPEVESARRDSVPAPAPVAAPRPETPAASSGTPENPAEEPVVSVDVRNFKYDYYLRLIQSKVERQWRQPVAGKERRAVVRFTISRRGRIEEAMIEESSGDDYFDQTVLRAVHFSDPFPPLPQGYLGPSLQIHYRFQFGENG